MINRAILHLDLDAFFASVECLRNRALQGKPLLVAGPRGRGLVLSCSREARLFGIRPHMPLRAALRRCPDALVLQGDLDTYQRYSQAVTDLLDEQAPLFEKAAIDEFCVDLSGMDRHLGCRRWADELCQRIRRETGLSLNIGLGANKLISKVGAGLAAPNQLQWIEPGTEKAFLAPLPLQRLPALEPALHQRLQFMGVRQIATLSNISPALLQRAFGPKGHELWKKANGIDNSPVLPYRLPSALSAEYCFETETTDLRLLRGRLAMLVGGLAYDLRRQQRLTASLTVKIRYADGNTHSRQQQLGATAANNILLRQAGELMEACFQRRQLVRLLGVRFDKLAPGGAQLDLFEQDSKDQRLQRAIDEVHARFGPKSLHPTSW